MATVDSELHNFTLADMLRRVTYKPGWSLRIINDFPGGNTLLRIKHPATCAYTGRHLNIDHGFEVPTSVRCEALFYAWVAERVIDAERHESREWLRVNGTPVVDPHGTPDCRDRYYV